MCTVSQAFQEPVVFHCQNVNVQAESISKQQQPQIQGMIKGDAISDLKTEMLAMMDGYHTTQTLTNTHSEADVPTGVVQVSSGDRSTGGIDRQEVKLSSQQLPGNIQVISESPFLSRPPPLLRIDNPDPIMISSDITMANVYSTESVGGGQAASLVLSDQQPLSLVHAQSTSAAPQRFNSSHSHVSLGTPTATQHYTSPTSSTTFTSESQVIDLSPDRIFIFRYFRIAGTS